MPEAFELRKYVNGKCEYYGLFISNGRVLFTYVDDDWHELYDSAENSYSLNLTCEDIGSISIDKNSSGEFSFAQYGYNVFYVASYK